MQLESFRQRKIDKYMKNWFKVKKDVSLLVIWPDKSTTSYDMLDFKSYIKSLTRNW